MADIFKKDNRDGYVYDPIIKQYDTAFWKSTTGTPAMSSSVLRFTSAAASSYLQHRFADVEFALKVPAAPTAGDVRQWGLRNPSSDKTGAVYFDVTDTTFSFKVADDAGTVTSTTLTWIAGYTNTLTYFRFRWEPDQIQVYINGTIVTTLAGTSYGLIIPFMAALALRINNGNADNMDLTYLRVREAAAII